MGDIICISKYLDLNLSLETCQEICFHGLNVFYAEEDGKARVRFMRVPELLGAVPSCGQDASLPNADTVREVFAGMTTRSLQTIQSLYCDPDGRSIRTVCMILDLAAKRNGVRSLHHEAVTIICLYLEKRRQEVVGYAFEFGTQMACRLFLPAFSGRIAERQAVFAGNRIHCGCYL